MDTALKEFNNYKKQLQEELDKDVDAKHQEGRTTTALEKQKDKWKT